MFLNNNNAVIQSSYFLCIKQKEVINYSLIMNHSFLFNTVAFNHRFYINGGAKESRTPDLLRARQALYQLSYGPM